MTPDKSAMAGFGDFERTLETLLKAIPAEGYLLGPKFSAVDVYMGSQISWGAQFGSVPKTAAVEAYLGRILSRRGAIRANALDDAAGAEYGPGG